MTLNNLAYHYSERLGNLDRAYELAAKARALEPKSAAIADTLGWILFKRGEYDKAAPLLEESAGKLPDNPEIQYHLGMAKLKLGATEAARQSLRRATGAAADFPGKEAAKRELALLESR